MQTINPQPVFDTLYQRGAPWDIGRPQPEIIALEKAGLIHGTVLDCGCGAGDNALYLAEKGHKVLGIDFVPLAIAKAEARLLHAPSLAVDFQVGDVLQLASLNRHFDTVIDSGVLHVFEPALRPAYIAAIGHVLRPGGTAHFIVFSEREPGSNGPFRMAESDIRPLFAEGWHLDALVRCRYLLNPDNRIASDSEGAQAWRISATRQPVSPSLTT